MTHEALPSAAAAAVSAPSATTTTSENLDALLQSAADGTLKFVFCGGKGGVGKTTTSSAVATLLATACGKRTLLVSTDPAHSLGDAFRSEFGGVPKSPLPNLSVMEIDPTESMKGALESWSEIIREASPPADDGDDAKEDAWATKMASFQQWLSGIPGIDEATALSEAIENIESGEYDVIVFDTAPTGHTLKLLALPEILQAGIEKLQSWQSTLWTYWDAFKGLTSTGSMSEASKRRAAKEKVSKKLEEYKRSIQKVALMLQDQDRTRFVVVCIAEYLSVSETGRLLTELQANRVRASHIVVNQLVVDTALKPAELERLEALAEVGGLGDELDQDVLQRTVHACRLTTSRKVIQTKYLGQLRNECEWNTGSLEGIVEVPLLPEEVTGLDALKRFGSLLVKDGPRPPSKAGEGAKKDEEAKAGPLYDDRLPALPGASKADEAAPAPAADSNDKSLPQKGASVTIHGLAKAAQYNGSRGRVVSDANPETGRYGVEVKYEGKRKLLALQPKNFTVDESSAKKSREEEQEGERNGAGRAVGDGSDVASAASSKLQKLLDDPEVREMVKGNPKYEAAVEDCLKSPMNALQYMGDPQMSPLISKIMSKMGTM